MLSGAEEKLLEAAYSLAGRRPAIEQSAYRRRALYLWSRARDLVLKLDRPRGAALLREIRPLGISTVRDRVCMTATMLVLEPIFEVDLPPEIYAYRAGRNAQQAVVEVEELVFRGHPDVVDADLADYFGSLPHADLLKSVARRVVDRRVLQGGLINRLRLTPATPMPVSEISVEPPRSGARAGRSEIGAQRR